MAIQCTKHWIVCDNSVSVVCASQSNAWLTLQLLRSAMQLSPHTRQEPLCFASELSHFVHACELLDAACCTRPKVRQNAPHPKSHFMRAKKQWRLSRSIAYENALTVRLHGNMQCLAVAQCKSCQRGRLTTPQTRQACNRGDRSPRRI